MTLGRSHTGAKTRRLPAHASLWAALLGLSLSAPAWAQPATPTTDADVSTQARELYNEGSNASKFGQWDQARIFYLGAWRVQHHWQIAASLGRAELRVDKFRDAAEHLQFALDEVSKLKPKDPDKAQKLEQANAEIQDLLAQAKAKVGTLTLSVEPAGAEVSVDQISVGKAPLLAPVFVEPGARTVSARLEGYKPAQATRELTAGGEDRVELQLVKEPQQAKGPGLTPGPLPPVKEQEGPNKTFVMVGTVVGAVAAGAGLGLTIAAEVKLLEREAHRMACVDFKTCKPFNAAEDARLNFAVPAITSYILAGVIGAGTLTYALVKRPAKPQSTARTDIFLGPGTAAAMVTVPW